MGSVGKKRKPAEHLSAQLRLGRTVGNQIMAISFVRGRVSDRKAPILVCYCRGHASTGARKCPASDFVEKDRPEKPNVSPRKRGTKDVSRAPVT